MPGYEITSDPARFDLDAIHAFLSTSYWARGIPRATLERAIANSIGVAALHEGRQVGFARVITDRATFAYLADVYVLEAHCGRGVAGRMMTHIKAHADLQGLRRMMLVTRDAHALYARFGFVPLSTPERVMELVTPNVYSSRANTP